LSTPGQLEERKSVKRVAKGWTTAILFLVGGGIFLFATTSRTVLEPIQPPLRCVLWTLSQGLNRQEG